MKTFMGDGKEDNSYKNNTDKLMYLYERYGYNIRYHFIEGGAGKPLPLGWG